MCGDVTLLQGNGRHPEPSLPLPNDAIAKRLEELAYLLENQGANLFRVGAYRPAAEVVRRLERPARHGQWTVITVQFGPLRGLNAACAAYYTQPEHKAPE